MWCQERTQEGSHFGGRKFALKRCTSKGTRRLSVDSSSLSKDIDPLQQHKSCILPEHGASRVRLSAYSIILVFIELAFTLSRSPFLSYPPSSSQLFFLFLPLSLSFRPTP